jgi:miniconductance mechanosensitive channel
MLEIIKEYLSTFQLTNSVTEILSRFLFFIIILITALLIDFIVRKKLISSIEKLFLNSKIHWDDELIHHNVLNRLAKLTPYLIIYFFIPTILEGLDSWIHQIQSVFIIFIIFLSFLVVNAIINAALSIYEKNDISKEVPLKGLAQIIKIIIFLAGTITVVATVIDKSPIYILSGLGAITAVLILIFKDTILGLIAGIQLITNKMIAKGDWIEMEKYGANGDVIDVSLHTVKVQNWDKTITSIPTYTLISDSFKNWRGMTLSGGRRIKRSIMIDLHTTKHLSNELFNKLKDIKLLSEYLRNKEDELEEFNRTNRTNDSVLNKRRLTNIGTFRIYILEYLKQHKYIKNDMTMIVRQLQANQYGLPLEVYCFSSDQSWVGYEAIQADIFDHIFSIIQEFELEIYQQPSGHDIKEILKK